MFADGEGTGILVILIMLGLLGKWIVGLFDVLQRRRSKIFQAACTLGVLTGIVFGLVWLRETNTPGTDAIGEAVFSGAMVGAVTTMGWYFAVALLLFLWEYVFSIPFRALSAFRRWRRAGSSRSAEEQLADELRRREREERQDRDRTRRQQEEEQSAQRRRDDARFACQMLYDQHRTVLRERLPTEQFRDYFARFLTDEQPADQVEQRAEQLAQMIRDIVDSDGAPCRKFRDLNQLNEHFRVEMETIRQLDCPQQQRDALLSDLAYEKARAIRELRQS